MTEHTAQPSTSPAQRSLWERWAAMRGRVVASLVGRGFAEADAEDIYAQALLRAWEARQRLDRPDAAESWFWTLTHRLAVDEARRMGRRIRLSEQPLLPDVPAAEPEGERCACSLSALATLPEPTRTLVEAVDVQGAAVQDAARQVGLTPNAASVRLYRARRTLRLRMFEQCGTTSSAACQDCGCGSRPDDPPSSTVLAPQRP